MKIKGVLFFIIGLGVVFIILGIIALNQGNGLKKRCTE